MSCTIQPLGCFLQCRFQAPGTRYSAQFLKTSRLLSESSFVALGDRQRDVHIGFLRKRHLRTEVPPGTVTCRAGRGSSPESPPAKLVTVLGKGGAGKTTAAVLLAKLYAAEGKQVCLALQGQDRVADELLGTKVTSTAASVPNTPGLTAVRLEATKLLLDPLAQLRKADASVGFSNGALDEVVGDELSILPGMDAFLVVGALESLARPGGGLMNSQTSSPRYDIVVFDGQSNGEILRMFGSAERTSWYLRRMRRLAEKTDAGRVALPTVARVIETAVEKNPGRERSTSEVWEKANDVLNRAARSFLDPNTFSCFLVAEEGNEPSVDTALRLWGSACQAGMHVQGALLSPGRGPSDPSDRFQPLPVAKLPKVSGSGLPPGVEEVKRVISLGPGAVPPPVKLSPTEGTVSLFLPGFDKSEVKLSKRGGGAELLVDVGDQRRSIELPLGMRGKVAGAKFEGGMLTVTLQM